MKKGLKARLSAGFAMIALITIFLISLAANLLINREFEEYIENQQVTFSSQLAESLRLQYNAGSSSWNLEYIHGMGMYALNDGYVIKLYDQNGGVVWDAENHDMTYCHQIMNTIASRMNEERPRLNGEFVTHSYPLYLNDTLIGNADISYYSPYYLNDDDFHFIDSLNRILLIIGIISVCGAVMAGMIFAGHITLPIVKTIQLTGEISKGNYDLRLPQNTSIQELNELTEAVNHLAESLARQEAMRKRLTTDAAHELRTPLTNVSSHLEAIIEGVWEPTPQRLSECYEEIIRISRLVSDLERLQQIESENLILHKAPADLLVLADSVRTAFEAGLHEKNLTCSVAGEHVVISADKERLYQVMGNLLSNSVKYSHEGGLISLTVKRENNWGIFIIEDEGIGIPEEELSLIFERFYRTDLSRSRKTGGAGIGLTIVKSIVQAHGGTVTAENRQEGGSRFIVKLPLLSVSQGQF